MTNPEIDFAREQQKEQIENDPSSLYADQLREERASNILSQINPDNILSEIEHRIRGGKKNPLTGNWEVPKDKYRTVSPLLISDFMSFLGSILNQNTSMSNFTQNEVNNMMALISDWIRQHFVVNAEAYGIEGNYSEYDRIGYIIMNNCLSVFKRALNGRESVRIFKMMRVNESTGPQRKNTFADNFKFW